jgi:hypothetical protein
LSLLELCCWCAFRGASQEARLAVRLIVGMVANLKIYGNPEGTRVFLLRAKRRKKRGLSFGKTFLSLIFRVRL